MKTAEYFMDIAKHNPEGFTVNVKTGEMADSGYAIAPSKLTETRLHRLTTRDMSFFLKKFAPVFKADKRAHLGGWYDKAKSEFVLDVSYVVNSYQDAAYMAELGNQDAFFDIEMGEEIPTDRAISSMKGMGFYSEKRKALSYGPKEIVETAMQIASLEERIKIMTAEL